MQYMPIFWNFKHHLDIGLVSWNNVDYVASNYVVMNLMTS